MSYSRLFVLSSSFITVLIEVQEIFAEKDQTCLNLQNGKVHIWALGGNGDRFLLITSNGKVFANMDKKNLKLDDGVTKLTINVPSKPILEELPKIPYGKIDFKNETKTKLLINDFGKGPILGLVDKTYNGDGTWKETSLWSFSLTDKGKPTSDSAIITTSNRRDEHIDVVASNWEATPTESDSVLFKIGKERTCLYEYFQLKEDKFDINHGKPDTEDYRLCVTNDDKDRLISAMFIYSKGQFLFFGSKNVTIADTIPWEKFKNVNTVPMSEFIDCGDLQLDVSTTDYTLDTTPLVVTKGSGNENLLYFSVFGLLIFVIGLIFWILKKKSPAKISRKKDDKKDDKKKSKISVISATSSRIFSAIGRNMSKITKRMRRKLKAKKKPKASLASPTSQESMYSKLTNMRQSSAQSIATSRDIRKPKRKTKVGRKKRK